jgi:hypothetical protein
VNQLASFAAPAGWLFVTNQPAAGTSTPFQRSPVFRDRFFDELNINDLRPGSELRQEDLLDDLDDLLAIDARTAAKDRHAQPAELFFSELDS